MTEKITVYGTPTCPMVPPVRNLLKRADADYTYIDISRDADAKATVLDINNGNASVPTLVFDDGTTLTEPSGRQLTEKLMARGYVVEGQTVFGRIHLLLQNPALAIAGIALLIASLLQGDTTFTLIGTALITAFIFARFRS